ncbi:MAG: class I SAM-dependent methyltransferase [Actinocatenispora sp.]
MTSTDVTVPDWADLLTSWDAQQTGYLPNREGRFTAMLDVLDGLLPDDFVAVDLACGPGSLSRRLLDRFPNARCVAVDLDPVLVELGRRTSEEYGDRLRWVEADVGAPELLDALGVEQADAVLSSTALHWLPADRLTALYTRLGTLVRPGGVFLDADNIPYAGGRHALQVLAETRRAGHAMAAFGEDMASGFRDWFVAASARPELAAALGEREKRFADLGREHAEPSVEMHLAALRYAGFELADVVWQEFDDRIIAAVR